ncbi:MAG: hypothetical protein WDM70_10095 [Nitrosomonadales bacterium]
MVVTLTKNCWKYNTRAIKTIEYAMFNHAISDLPGFNPYTLHK